MGRRRVTEVQYDEDLKKTWFSFGGRKRLEVGGAPGAPVIRKFPFAFDTPGLLTGAALYTPTVGDVLLDAWFEIDTAWDGTTPQADLGHFASGYGMFASVVSAGAIPVDGVDTSMWSSGLLAGSSTPSLASVSAMYDLISSYDFASGNWADAALNLTSARRVVPAKFSTTDSIKVCVSTTGATTGADPGSTAGAAVLYLVTATPV